MLLTPDDLTPYERSARHAGGKARGVLRPATTDETAAIVHELVAAGVSFVSQGAATGLVAAATPTEDATQWVLSTQRLRDNIQVDPVNRTVRVSAGYRLSDVNRVAGEYGLCFPIDLGADPSVGGMIATNTGGARLIRYGGVRQNVLGVQAVLVRPAGQIVQALRGLRKDNTGLDWCQVFTGTFGSYGVVTEAVLRLHPLPRQSATALIAVSSVEAAIELLVSMEASLGEFVAAFEGISGAAIRAAVDHLPGAVMPFAEAPAYCVLAEATSAIGRDSGLDIDALLVAWLEKELETGSRIVDAVVDKPDRLWRLRHGVSEAVQSLGRMVAFDLCVTRSRFAALRAQAINLVYKHVQAAQVCDFGHLADGGIHLNMIVPTDTPPDTIRNMRSAIYDLTVNEFSGSYSAEHGIGPTNAAFYRRYADEPTVSLARALNEHFDPHHLLGNVRLG